MMQRPRGSPWQYASVGVCACARRHFRNDLSPDRTYSELIQDSQNRFVWHREHTFRPHQHFTYDPTSWSRTLEAQSKQRQHQVLSLIERVRMEEERRAERRGHVFSRPDAHSLEKGDPTQSEDIPNYFFADTDAHTASRDTEATGPWDRISLQELLDAVSAAQMQLTQPRFRGGEALAVSERLRHQMREVLYRVLERLEQAVVDETMTLDALVYGWFIALRSREELLTAVATHQGDGLDSSAQSDAFEVAAQRITEALRRTLFSEDVMRRLPSLSLEGLIEALHLLLHPSTRQLIFATPLESAAAPAVYVDTRHHLVVSVNAALSAAERQSSSAPSHTAREGSEDGEPDAASSLPLDPVHIATLADVLQRLTAQSSDVVNGDVTDTRTPIAATYASFVSLLNRSGRAVLDTLRSSLPVSERQRTVCALTKRSDTMAKPTRRAVALDASGPPRGIRTPRTEPGDVPHLVQAYAAALASAQMAVASASPSSGLRGTYAQLNAMMETVLALVSYAPNYDLPAVDTVRLLHVLLNCLRLDATHLSVAADEASWLRLALLLSRVDFLQVATHPVMITLYDDLCHTPEPLCFTPTGRAEWRRLRGVALHHLLSATSAERLTHTGREDNVVRSGGQSWEAAAAFGAASTSGTPTVIPLTLWEQACLERLGGPSDLYAPEGDAPPCLTTGRCSSETAAALIILRARLGSVRRGAQARSVLDDVTVRYVAASVHVALHAHPSFHTLLSAEDGAWDEALARLFDAFPMLQDYDAVSALFAGVNETLQCSQRVRSKVMAFN